MVTADTCRYVLHVETAPATWDTCRYFCFSLVRWTSLTSSQAAREKDLRTLWVLDSFQWGDRSTPEQLEGHPSVGSSAPKAKKSPILILSEAREQVLPSHLVTIVPHLLACNMYTQMVTSAPRLACSSIPLCAIFEKIETLRNQGKTSDQFQSHQTKHAILDAPTTHVAVSSVISGEKKSPPQKFLPPSPLSKTISGSRLTAGVKLALCPPVLLLFFSARSCTVFRLPCSGQMLFPPVLFLTSNGQRGLPGKWSGTCVRSSASASSPPESSSARALLIRARMFACSLRFSSW